LVGVRGVGPVPACRRIWVLAAEVEAEGAIGRVWMLPAGYRSDRRSDGSGDNRVLLMSYRARSRGRARSGAGIRVRRPRR
jgi:hypothetical protein